jgi:hypothetical protein
MESSATIVDSVRARWTAVLGIGWLACFIVGAAVLQGEPPAYDAAIPEIRVFFAEHGGRYLVGDVVAGAGFVLLLVPFAITLPGALGVPDRTAALWGRLSAAGAVALVTVGGVATSFLDAVAIARGGPRLDDSTITALLYANMAGIALIGLPAALFVAAAAALVWYSTLPRAVAVLGWIAAPLLVVGAAFPIDPDPRGPLWTIRFVSFIMLALFVLATSILLASRPPRPAQLPG